MPGPLLFGDTLLDLTTPAEMYTGRQSAEGRARPYRRFSSLREAVLFAVEGQPAALICTTIETDDGRLQNKEIRAVYDSAGFRTATADS